MKKLLAVFILSSSLLALSFSASAQFTDIVNFTYTSTPEMGYDPSGDVIRIGNLLYGTSWGGGLYNYGNIFSVDTNGNNYRDLYDFDSLEYGAEPNCTLIPSGGVFYGITMSGGINTQGNIFKIDTNGSGYKDLWDFDGGGDTNGSDPTNSNLTLYGNKLYGMTYAGGEHKDGNIFSIDTNGSGYKDLWDFKKGHDTNGSNPYGSLTLLGGKLYGMTYYGGIHDDGNIFSIDTNGSGYKDLWDFQSGVPTNGDFPNVNCLLFLGKAFYGMTTYGGKNNYGTIFKIDTNGSGYVELWSFDGGGDTNGKYPIANLTLSGSKLYGTTWGGGKSKDGNIFSIDTNGEHYTDLVNFNVANGKYPCADILVSGNNLYGTAQFGGANNYGVVFSYALLTVTATYTNVTCNGGDNGVATANATGGISPYTYQWNDANSQTTATATGLVAGTYTVYVHDNNDVEDSAIVSITQPTPLLLVTADTCVPIVLTNSQSVATSANFQQMITVNSSNYTSLENAGLQNVEFTTGPGGTGAVLQAWVESGATNTSTNTVYWVNLGSSIIPAGGTLKVYMNFMPTSVMSASGPTGEAPQLSSTYGQYDNGASVFNYYTNFAGTSLPSNWVDSNQNYTVNNGLQITNASSPSFGYIGYNVSTSLPVVMDTYVSSWPSGTNESYYSEIWWGAGSNGFSNPYNAPYAALFLANNNSTSGGWSFMDASGGYSNVSNPPVGIVSEAYTPTSSSISYNYGSATTLSYSFTSPAVFGGQLQIYAAGGTWGMQYMRLRTLPPNSAMPTIAAGSVIYPIAIANATCHGGSASVNPAGGTTPYTYTWSNGENTQTISGLSAGTYSVSVKDNCGADSVINFTITQPSELRDSIKITNINCFGGTGNATANVGGGSLPYTYTWSNGASVATITGLSAGTYSVSIKDACGADSTMTITIKGASELRDSVSFTNITCNGGTTNATANVAGGGTPYTYQWNDPNNQTTATATGLNAGTYSVSIKDNCGADSVLSITITQPNALNGTATILANVDCSGINGIALATASGGNSPYTYTWSNGESGAIATGLSAGTYSVSIQDACGTDSIVNITLTQASSLTVSAITTANISCYGGNTGSASSSVSGGVLPYNYLWTNGGGTNATATGLSAGTYTVTVTDACGGAPVTANVVITQPDMLSVSSNVIANVNCNGSNTGSAAAAISGGTQPYTYLWSDANSQTTATATGLSAGTYRVSIKDACGADSVLSITITQPSELRDSVSFNNITCNGSTVNATANVGGGTLPYTYMWSNSQTIQTATGLVAGTYSVSIKDNCGADSVLSITITQPSELRDSVSFNNITCNGGTVNATANVTGGTLPYTYIWSNSQTTPTATGLSAGTYSVSIKDACGADSTISITITQPVALNGLATILANVDCGGMNGVASATANGGNSPYTYTWSNGEHTAIATGLSAGTYSVSIQDACGADSIVNITLTQANSLIISASVTANIICNGTNTGSVAASISGGIAPYNYLWSNGGGTNATATGLSAGTYTVSVTDACGGSPVTASVVITQPAALNGSATILNNVDCGGGNGVALATASGGNSPYTYTWSNGESGTIATGLSAGTYSVSVQDACGADSIVNITLTQASSLTVSANVTANINCNGSNTGSASSSVSGGIAPYNYLWSDGGGTNATASGLSAGIYTVTVTDACGGSPVTANVVITQPVALNGLATILTNVDCGGINGIASASASGGTSPYTYAWSNGEHAATATGLSAGTYSVSIQDACGADSIVNITLTQANSLTVSASVTANITCYGTNTGSATSSISGGMAPYNYLWSNGGGTNTTATGLSAGTYTVAVTNACGGAPVTANVVITEPTSVSVFISSTDDNGTNNGSATVNVSGGVMPYTYLWTPGDGTTNSIAGLSQGSYCCDISDANGCTENICVTVNSSAGINSISNSSGINIYPDPTIGNFTVAGVSAGQVIEMYNYLGEKLSSTTVSNNTTMHFDISNKANGIYLIRILNSDGTLVTERKMVKTE